jgi:hypothetical protein
VLQDVRELGLEVVPLCPFIAACIRSHADEYLDLVVPAMRESLVEDGRPLSSGRASPWATCRVLPPGSPTTGEVLSP